MTLFQNPIIFLSLFLSLITFSSRALSETSEAELQILCDLSTSQKVLTSMNEFLKKSKRQEAYSCLLKAIEKYPKNRDLIFKKIRILSWDKKFSEAKVELLRWKEDDFQYYLIAGDLAWYQEDCKEALIFYQKAEELGSVKNFDSSSLHAYLTCSKKMTVITEKNRKALLKRAGQSLVPGSYSSLKDEKRLDDSLIVEFSRSFQSDAQGLSSYTFDLEKKVGSRFSFSVKGLDTYRFSSSSTLNDQVFGAGLSFFWSESHKTTAKASFSYDSDFVYRNLQEMSHEVFLEDWYLSFRARRTSFELNDIYLISSNVGYYFSSFYLEAKAYYGVSLDLKHSGSAGLSFQYENPSFLLSSWVLGGVGEASRSYIIGENQTPHVSYGGKFTYLASFSFHPYLVYDGRTENSF